MKTDPSPAPALQRIRELQEQGHNQRDIAQILESEGIPAPGRSKTWNQSAVRLLLQRLDAPAPAPSPPPAPPAPAVPAPAPAVPAPATAPPAPSTSAPAPPPQRRATRRFRIKIEGPWIHTDGLFWEFLIHKVWDQLTEKTDHILPLQEVLNGLSLSPRRRDLDHLWEALDRLAASRVKLEDQKGDERLCISAPLLSSILTQEDLSFQFPSTLIKMVKNAQQYIRLKELLTGKN